MGNRAETEYDFWKIAAGNMSGSDSDDNKEPFIWISIAKENQKNVYLSIRFEYPLYDCIFMQEVR